MKWLSVVIVMIGCGQFCHAADRPNVLILLGDDMAWTDYGFMNHPAIRTPHLDQLAKQGMLYPNGYTPTSLCRASLATILTGLYAHQHNICCNDPPKGVDRAKMLPFLGNAPTIPRLLGKAGYSSLQTGKFWEGHFSNGGFTHGMTKTGRHGEEGLAIGRTTMKPIYDFIEQSGEKPWFVWYAPMMPHTPHNPPERILKRYRQDGRDERLAKYFAMCEWFDETCGELLAYLDRKQLADNTIVIYVVDNGWIQTAGPVRMGEQFLTRSKNTPYEAGVRTPIIVRWPGKVKPGKSFELVSTIDIAPTILRACGAEVPANMEGIDLIALANGKVKGRDQLFGEIFTHDCVELGKPQLSVTHRWVREGQWKLILPVKDGKAELYHLADDPNEGKNLLAMHADRAARLQKMIEQWWALIP